MGKENPQCRYGYSIFGTYAVNLVFPRLGEVWRTGYIAQRQKAPFTTVFGSMVAAVLLHNGGREGEGLEPYVVLQEVAAP